MYTYQYDHFFFNRRSIYVRLTCWLYDLDCCCNICPPCLFCRVRPRESPLLWSVTRPILHRADVLLSYCLWTRIPRCVFSFICRRVPWSDRSFIDFYEPELFFFRWRVKAPRSKSNIVYFCFCWLISIKISHRFPPPKRVISIIVFKLDWPSLIVYAG